MRKRGKYERTPAATRYEKMKKRTLLQSYMISLVSLCLCVTMLMGSTMAWFTSGVESGGNEIYIGTLAVDLLLGDQSLKEPGAPKVFSNDIAWFPDHIETRVLTVQNTGGLDFTYSLVLSPAEAASPVNAEDLTSLFTVYVRKGAVEGDVTFEELNSSWTPVGTLAQLFEKETPVFAGKSEEMTDQKAVYTIAVYMHEDAPSDVMGERLNFNIKLVANQIGAPETVTDQEELKEALADGAHVTLGNNIKVTENMKMNGGTVNGGGKTLDATEVPSNSDCAITTTGGSVKNLTVNGDENKTRAIGSGSSGKTKSTENLYIDNVTIDKVQYAINGHGDGTSKVVVTNSTIYGWCSYSDITSFDFANCTLGKGNSYHGYMVVYGNTSFTNCTFKTFDMCADTSVVDAVAAGGEKPVVTFTNCTNDGKKVTAENFKELFMYPGDDTDFDKLRNCTIIIDGETVSWN